ncbi:hypothetical protein T492DRAFT_844907 [Pavlovales sp. CCMP2436]|nr:hypothetical protein T492DRAFT_844907 [Pavlovales sp. CCMP2436]
MAGKRARAQPEVEDNAALIAEVEALRCEQRKLMRNAAAAAELATERTAMLKLAGLSYDELSAVVVRERVARLSDETQAAYAAAERDESRVGWLEVTTALQPRLLEEVFATGWVALTGGRHSCEPSVRSALAPLGGRPVPAHGGGAGVRAGARPVAHASAKW